MNCLKDNCPARRRKFPQLWNTCFLRVVELNGSHSCTLPEILEYSKFEKEQAKTEERQLYICENVIKCPTNRCHHHNESHIKDSGCELVYCAYSKKKVKCIPYITELDIFTGNQKVLGEAMRPEIKVGDIVAKNSELRLERKVLWIKPVRPKPCSAQLNVLIQYENDKPEFAHSFNLTLIRRSKEEIK